VYHDAAAAPISKYIANKINNKRERPVSLALDCSAAD